ncbi:MAG: hypothetical protein RRY41_13960, partial [Burkholderiaceae bacterium]
IATLIATLITALIAVPIALPFAAHAQSLEIIDLRHRTAEDLLPLLEPLLAPGGSISGRGWQLFVRTTPNNLSELRRVLATLDAPARQLIITVRQDRAGAINQQDLGVNGGVVVGSGGISSSGQIRARDSRTVNVTGGQQTLRVADGGRALIALTTAVPFRFNQWSRSPGGWTETHNTAYIEAVRGFVVTPRVRGDRVSLEISPQDEQFTRSGAIEGLRLATTVEGGLGEWIALGGTIETGGQDGDGTLSSSRSAQSSTRGVWVRVEPASSLR